MKSTLNSPIYNQQESRSKAQTAIRTTLEEQTRNEGEYLDSIIT